MRLTLLPALFLAAPAFADPGDYGHMTGYGYGIGMMFGPVLWLLVLGGVVAGVIWFARSHEPSVKTSSARAALDLRFANGEIDANDYAARKKLMAE